MQIPTPLRLPLTLVALAFLASVWFLSDQTMAPIGHWTLVAYLSLIIIGIGGLWWLKKNRLPPPEN